MTSRPGGEASQGKWMGEYYWTTLLLKEKGGREIKNNRDTVLCRLLTTLAWKLSHLIQDAHRDGTNNILQVLLVS